MPAVRLEPDLPVGVKQNYFTAKRRSSKRHLALYFVLLTGSWIVSVRCDVSALISFLSCRQKTIENRAESPRQIARANMPHIFEGSFSRRSDVMKSTKVLLAALAVLCLIAGASQAAVLAQDNFESYTVGLLGSSANGGTGWAGAWKYNADYSNINIASTSMSYVSDTISVYGGTQSLAITDVQGHETIIGRAFETPVSSDVVYVSFLYQTAAHTIQTGFGKDTATPSSSSIWATAGNKGANFWTRTAQSGSSGYDDDSTTTYPISYSSVYLYVVKLSKVGGSANYNQIELFVNPTSDAESSTGCVYYLKSVGDTTIASATEYVFRNASYVAGGVTYIDNLMVSTSFADVYGVPEPMTMGLLVVGGIATLLRRRRNA
jgi:hypothetical protein